jgi:hypothetical protein
MPHDEACESESGAQKEHDHDTCPHIPGRGTVVIGQLQGNVPLNVGDTLACEDGRWKVRSIEQFRTIITTAEPGAKSAFCSGKARQATRSGIGPSRSNQEHREGSRRRGSGAGDAGPRIRVRQGQRRAWFPGRYGRQRG